MNIFHEKTGDLTGVLKVNIDENDYNEKVEKAVKDLQKKAQLPGFRPGKVPAGIIKKQYGKSIVVEQVNKMLGDAVYNYLKDNNIDILGNPIPDHDHNNNIDWDNQKEFEFRYFLGFSPEIDITLSDDIKVDYYKIKVEDKVVDEQVERMLQQYGKMANPEESGEQDIVSGELTQMADEATVATDGLTNKPNIHIGKIVDEDIKSKFLSRQVGDQVVFDLNSAFEAKDAATVAGVKEDEMPGEGTSFRFTIESISRLEPAKMDEEFFKKISQEKEINNEKELRDMIREQVSKQYQAEADRFFRDEVFKTLLEKANIDLPEEFLKKWLVESDKENMSKEKVEEEFNNYADSFRKQLLENKLIEDHNLQVKEEELLDYLRKYIRMQLMQYGQTNIDDETVETFVKNILEKKEEVEKISRSIVEGKYIDLFKNNLKLKEKEVTFDELSGLVSEKYKKGSEKDNKETE